MFSDSFRNYQLGFGGICQSFWMFMKWDHQFMLENDPSIAYLELYPVLATVMNWVYRFRNKRIILFCDNEGVVEMINSSSSKCRNCMVLIRLLVLQSMVENVRVFAKHIKSKINCPLDLLSRMKITQFRKENPQMEDYPTDVPEAIWQISKIWLK